MKKTVIDITAMKTYKGLPEKKVKELKRFAQKELDKVEARLEKAKTPSIRKTEKFVNEWYMKNKPNCTQANLKKARAEVIKHLGKDAMDELHNFNEKNAVDNTESLKLQTAILAMKMQMLRDKCERENKMR